MGVKRKLPVHAEEYGLETYEVDLMEGYAPCEAKLHDVSVLPHCHAP